MSSTWPHTLSRCAAGAAIAFLSIIAQSGVPLGVSTVQAQTAPPTWTPIGPVPGSGANGRVLTIAIDPSGKLYLGGPGGVWTSTNNGTSWSGTTDQQPSIDVASIAIDPNRLANPVDPNNPYAIYAGTGDLGGVTGLPGAGVMKSVDGGATWTTLNPNGMFTGLHTTKVAIDPHGSVLYVATDQGVFVSSDGGATFPTNLLNGQTVTALVLDPTTTPTTIYAAVQGVGIEKSTDGTNFTVLGGGLPAGTLFGNTALAIAPSNNQVLYASVGQPSAPNALTGVYKTTNGGTTWTQLTLSPDYTMYGFSQGMVSQGQAFANNVLVVSPGDPNTVYGAGVSLAKSTDGGATWTNLSASQVATSGLGGDFHTLVFDSKGDLYAGSDAGINELTKDGQVANLNSNLDTIMFYPGMSQIGNGSTILAGAQDNAIWVYSGSPTWRIGISADGFETAIDPLNPNIMYGTTAGGVYMTTDQFQTVQKMITPPTVPGGSGPWVKPLAIAPNVGSPDVPTVYYGADKVYTSPDGGNTWNNGNNAYALTGSFTGVSALAVAPSNPQVVYAGFTDGTMQVSVDRGADWTTITPPSSAPNCMNCVGMWITHIAVDPTNENNVTVTFSGTALPHTSLSPPHVVQGTNAESATPTWTEVTGNLPNEASNTVVYSGANLIVGTEKGVYSGSPNGANTNWIPTATGLPRAPVNDLALTPNGTLIATTFGRGAWTTTVPSIAPNGTGTMTVTPATVASAGTGLTLTFTYTAGNGGLNNGEVDLTIPSAWTTPTMTNTTASTGTLAITGQTVMITGLTLPAGGLLTITYGAGGTVTAPATLGANTFVTREQSGATPPITALGVQPQVTVTTTGGTAPAAPTGVMVSPGAPGVCTDGSGSIDVSWNAPPQNGGSPITSYAVAFSPGGGGFNQPATNGTSVMNICGFDKTMSFTATVTATNANGTGPPSAPSGAITPATVAAAPTDVSTVPGNEVVEVMWDPPTKDNGANITGYTVTAEPGDESITVPADQTSAVLSGLTDGVNYTITVVANDEYGASPPADTSVDPSSAPGVPYAPSDATVTPGDGQATVSWSAPYDNGSPINYYTVTVYPGGRTVTVAGDQTSTIVNGLTNGDDYTFTVSATNGVGQSPPSDPTDSIQGAPDQGGGDVMRTAPSAPLTVHAVPGNSQATISWNDPANLGGAEEVMAYEITASPGGQHIQVDGGENSATMTGLHNGTPYTFTVVAFTNFGEGPRSAPSNSVTPVGCTSFNGARGALTLGPGNWCLGGTIAGPVTIRANAVVSIEDATITAGVHASGAARLTICDSTIGGVSNITGTTGFLLIGDSIDDDCPGNTLNSVLLFSNHGGLDLQGNILTGTLLINSTTGAGPAFDDSAPNIGYNFVEGSLVCTNNVPPPTNKGNPNIVTGIESGQCAGL